MAPDRESSTENDIEDHIAAGVGYRFPSIDDLLLELVQEGVVLLLLAQLLLVACVLGLVGLVLVPHLNIIIAY
jgi:hypothetical protein